MALVMNKQEQIDNFHTVFIKRDIILGSKTLKNYLPQAADEERSAACFDLTSIEA